MNEIERDVRLHLSNLRLSDAEEENVIREITTHLEYAEEEIDLQNVTGTDRERRILTEVGDWNQLKKGIRRYKENVMRDRFRRLWLPAMLTGILAYAAQTILYRLIGPGPLIATGTWVYSWQWLLLLFATGAFGAYLSRRLGGSLVERVLVALAPAEAMLAAMAIGLPIGFTMEMVTYHRVPYALHHPGVLLAAVAMVVLLPAVPSILGAIPFLLGNSHAGKVPATT